MREKIVTRTIETDEVPVDLSIPVEKVCEIIMRAREVAEEDLIEDPDATEPAPKLEQPEEPQGNVEDLLEADMKGFISELTLDEQIDLVALMWLGRDDHTPDEWQSVRAEAADAHNEHTAEYLCGNPLLADHLTEGLGLLGYSLDDFERKHL